MNLNNNKVKKHKISYKRNGYVVLKNFIDKKKIEFIKNDLLIFLAKKSKNLKIREVNFIKNTQLINSVHNLKNWPLLKKLQSQKKIINLARIFLDEKVRKFGAELFAKPPKIGLASPMHQDNYYWNINGKGLTIWIALDRSNKSNGAVSYYKKSQQLGLLDHKLSMVPGSSQKVKNIKKLNKFKIKTPKLNPGDALIHDSLIVHGSKKNTSKKSRVGLTMRYIGTKSKINYLLKKKYEKQLKKQLILLNKNAGF